MGITAFTSNINRAYELAKVYRKKKTKVIFGGIHAPGGVLQHGDSVVVGDVEGIGGSFLPAGPLNLSTTPFTIIWGRKRLLGGWFNPPAGNDRGINKPSGIPDIP